MINDITTDTEDGMKKAVDSFKRDLQKIRTGPREHRDARRHQGRLLRHADAGESGRDRAGRRRAAHHGQAVGEGMIAVIDKAIRASDLGINPVAD